ncbi:alpha/beta hydrolase [Luteibacter aegosomatissinici]|uniref:alpha/beta hydrolase n=1 Tax=Luteibacter aegosomatissinici TaxID=2911539 RepID=UPI001FF8CD20|nr:alpha/beta hydrolase [Luteibacter aegosomatissinici]UPG95299.1 alpha/beta hydrolase [Luteibacter aegosomatissinici]
MKRMTRWVLLLIAFVVLTAIAATVSLYAMQDRLLYPGADATQPLGNLQVSRPDIVMRGWILHPEAEDALVVFGGNGMSLSRYAPRLEACTKRAIYLMPYRGYEGQAGKPGERAFVADGIALVDEVRKTHARVGILGISIGTGVATQVALARKPDMLWLVTPYDTMTRVANDNMHGLPVGLIMRDPFDSEAAARQLTGVPIIVLQANHDEIVPAARTEALVRALPQPPVEWVHVDAGHNTILSSPEMCRALATR